MSTLSTVRNLKSADEDFEWYPTTEKMVDIIHENCIKKFFDKNSGYNVGILDIGAGDGRVLKRLETKIDKDYHKNTKLLGIEKSQILQSKLFAEGINVIMADFEEGSCVGYASDIVFCNPPYSKYEDWICKILAEIEFKMFVFIVPSRWEDSARIKSLADSRGVKCEKVWSGNFLDADRSARATIDIVMVSESRDKEWNALEQFVKSEFAELSKTFEVKKIESAEKTQHKEGLVKSDGVVFSLLDNYAEDIRYWLDGFHALEKVPIEAFSALNICWKSFVSVISEKAQAMRRNYWKSLFEHFEPINRYLCSDEIGKCLRKIDESNPDFVSGNVSMVIHFVLSNTASRLKDQAIQVYDRLVNISNISIYKSNERLFAKNEWRSLSNSWRGMDEVKKRGAKYKLELRCVSSGVGLSYCKHFRSCSFPYTSANFIHDIRVVARCLGFDSLDEIEFNGKKTTISQIRGGIVELPSELLVFKSDGGVLFRIKLFKNGNGHIFFDLDFMRRWNVEYGRLKGWLTTKEDAKEEFGQEAELDFGTLPDINRVKNLAISFDKEKTLMLE